MDFFADQNFSNFVFDWHVREGKQARLLSQNYSGQRNKQLGNYLKGHSELSWMHEIETNRFSDAVNTLKNLAYNETENIATKKVNQQINQAFITYKLYLTFFCFFVTDTTQHCQAVYACL